MVLEPVEDRVSWVASDASLALDMEEMLERSDRSEEREVVLVVLVNWGGCGMPVVMDCNSVVAGSIDCSIFPFSCTFWLVGVNDCVGDDCSAGESLVTCRASRRSLVDSPCR